MLIFRGLLGGSSQLVSGELVTPFTNHFTNHLGHLEGEQPSLRGLTIHGYEPLTSWDDPPSNTLANVPHLISSPGVR